MLTPAVLLVIAPFLVADVVVLKNGNEIQGEIMKDGEDGITLKFPGGVLELPRKQVKEVKRQPRIQYLLEEGEKEIQRGSFEDAIQTFGEAAREDPGSDRAQKGRRDAQEKQALSLQGAGRFSEAKAALKAILARDPGDLRPRAEIETIDQTLEEARKEEERGRAELREGDLEKGIWRLQRVFDRFPERREVLGRVLAGAIIDEGNRLFSAQNWRQAEDRYLKALVIEPELLSRAQRQLVFSKAKQIEPVLQKGDFATVERMCAEGLELDPSSEVLRYYHGVALEGKGRARDAAEEYLLVTEGKRPGNLKEAVADLRHEAEAKLLKKENIPPTLHPRAREVLPGDFRELKTRHFTVRQKNAEIAREASVSAEKSYEEIFQALGCLTQLRNPLQVIIYPTKEEYLAASGLQSWSGGGHFVARKMGDLSDHRIYSFQDQPRLTTGVLPHEIAHALLQHRLNYPEKVPLWANEGFAVLREPEYFHRYYRRILSQNLAQKTLLRLKDILFRAEYPQENVELFYAQAFSTVEFLVSESGLDTFVNFVKGISRSGADFDSSLQRYYKIAGAVALENRWIAWFERRG
jgi:tetratricopeptide (TPR) repeat protein